MLHNKLFLKTAQEHYSEAGCATDEMRRRLPLRYVEMI